MKCANQRVVVTLASYTVTRNPIQFCFVTLRRQPLRLSRRDPTQVYDLKESITSLFLAVSSSMGLPGPPVSSLITARRQRADMSFWSPLVNIVPQSCNLHVLVLLVLKYTALVKPNSILSTHCSDLRRKRKSDILPIWAGADPLLFEGRDFQSIRFVVKRRKEFLVQSLQQEQRVSFLLGKSLIK